MSDDRRPSRHDFDDWEDGSSDPEVQPEPDDGVPLPHHRRPSRRLLTLAILPIALVMGLGTLSNWFLRPYLTAEHPLLLLLADPRALNMLLVEHQLDAFSYYAMVLFRRLFADPSHYFLGYWYGAAAIALIKRYSPELGNMAVKLEQWFPRFGWLLMLFYPHQLVMVIAGASAMRFRTFMALDAAGTILVAVAVRLFGELVEPQVKAVNGFISDYWLPLTGVSIALFVLLYLSSAKKEQGAGQIQSLRDLDQEADGGFGSDPLDRPRRRPRPEDY